MSSSYASYVSSLDLGSLNPNKHKTSDDEPRDANAYGSSAPSKGIGWSDIPSVFI